MPPNRSIYHIHGIHTRGHDAAYAEHAGGGDAFAHFTDGQVGIGVKDIFPALSFF